MASTLPVVLAGFLYIIFGISIFMAPRDGSCSPAPPVASWIFSFAALLLAKDVTMYPKSYINLPYIFEFAVDTIGSLVMVELAVGVVWCSIEQLLHQVLRLLLLFLGMKEETYLPLEFWLLLPLTTAVAGVLLYIMTMAVMPGVTIKCLSMCQVQLESAVHAEMVAQNMRRIKRIKRALKF